MGLTGTVTISDSEAYGKSLKQWQPKGVISTNQGLIKPLQTEISIASIAICS